jgi:hypothetical protein
MVMKGIEMDRMDRMQVGFLFPDFSHSHRLKSERTKVTKKEKGRHDDDNKGRG